MSTDKEVVSTKKLPLVIAIVLSLARANAEADARSHFETKEKIRMIAASLLALLVAWIATQFHVSETGHYGHDSGALEELTMVVAMVLFVPGCASFLSLLRRALGLSWVGVLVPVYLMVWVVVLTVTHGW